MAEHRPRPPMNTIDAGWERAQAKPDTSDAQAEADTSDDDGHTEVRSPFGLPAALDAPPTGGPLGASEEGSEVDEPEPPEAPTTGGDIETVTLPGLELDVLVGATAGESTDVLGGDEVDRLLQLPLPDPRTDPTEDSITRPSPEDTPPPAEPGPAPVAPAGNEAMGPALQPTLPAWSQPQSIMTPFRPVHALSGPPPPPAGTEKSKAIWMGLPVRRALLVAGAALVVTLLVFFVWLFARPKTQPGAGIVLPGGSAPAGDSAARARSALERFRDGLRTCVTGQIGVLPGTSPAVPPSLALVKGGGYKSAVSDWRTPVWACTRFQVTEPQPFQIQWQQTKLNVEGVAVAWLDDDGDGKPDRAFGFRATLKKRGEIELGEVGPFDAGHPIAAVK